MADPISVYPIFVRNQSLPVTSHIVIDDLDVVLEDAEVEVEIEIVEEVPVLMAEGFTVVAGAIGIEVEVQIEDAEIAVEIEAVEEIPVLLPEGITICFE